MHCVVQATDRAYSINCVLRLVKSVWNNWTCVAAATTVATTIKIEYMLSIERKDTHRVSYLTVKFVIFVLLVASPSPPSLRILRVHIPFTIHFQYTQTHSHTHTHTSPCICTASLYCDKVFPVPFFSVRLSIHSIQVFYSIFAFPEWHEWWKYDCIFHNNAFGVYEDEGRRMWQEFTCGMHVIWVPKWRDETYLHKNKRQLEKKKNNIRIMWSVQPSAASQHGTARRTGHAKCEYILCVAMHFSKVHLHV